MKPNENSNSAKLINNVKDIGVTLSVPTRNTTKTDYKYSSRWSLKSVDTMKYSRDKARESRTNPELKGIIEKQVVSIANTGATHIAIGTPYDEEFLSVMEFWVKEARRNNLKVFFRGNFSGWEKWNGYAKIDRETHIQKTKNFIEKNPGLFQDGDLFSSCPECENGEKLDRSNPIQINEYRTFLIKEYNVTKEAFKNINKQVPSNYYSMNGDIAFLMMDRKTTAAFDGLVVIDHYVKDTARLERDIKALALKSGGKIVLGEFGAPIPGIHGSMDERVQKKWIEDALQKISGIPDLIGINYWVGTDGSTAIWKDNGVPKPAVEVLTRYYKASNSSD
ncbi:MAG TPA: hypothetical protein VM077_05900 [Candidatus Limnocylindrales bacterium]|nr:hypothetical protein [Candidatus Limnocylindrales bacterium]